MFENWRVLIAVGATLALAGFVAGRMRREATPSNLTVDGRLLLTGPRCEALRSEYKATLASAQYCTGNDTCVAQRRDGFLYDLDEGARYVVPTATGPADALAKSWAEGGCAQTHVNADEPGVPRCYEGRCERTPPAAVPDDWKRHALVDVGAIWLPPRSTVTLRHPGCGYPSSLEILTVRPGRSESDTLRVHVGFTPDEPTEKPREGIEYLGTPKAPVEFQVSGLPARLRWDNWSSDVQGDKRQYCEMQLIVARADRYYSPQLRLQKAHDGTFVLSSQDKTCDNMGYLETVVRSAVLFQGDPIPPEPQRSKEHPGL